jgi:hypothetical protein
LKRSFKINENIQYQITGLLINHPLPDFIYTVLLAYMVTKLIVCIFMYIVFNTTIYINQIIRMLRFILLYFPDVNKMY